MTSHKHYTIQQPCQSTHLIGIDFTNFLPKYLITLSPHVSGDVEDV